MRSCSERISNNDISWSNRFKISPTVAPAEPVVLVGLSAKMATNPSRLGQFPCVAFSWKVRSNYWLLTLGYFNLNAGARPAGHRDGRTLKASAR